MDLVTRADLEMLTRTDDGGEHICMFLPTHRSGADVQGDPLRFKNLLAGVESALTEQGVRPRQIEDLLFPARALQRDAMAWQYMSDGLAMYLRPGWSKVFRVPMTLPEVATVGNRFVIGPLLRLLSGDEHFLVLALSQRMVRLFGGSRDRIEELELGAVPTSLLDVTEPAEPRSDAMARPVSPAGRGGPAIFYGYGARDSSDTKEDVRWFLRQVADGLRDYLGNQDLPMVLVGLTEVVAMYRGLNDYPHVLADAVERNPDDLSAAELHEIAWPVIAGILEERARGALAQLAELQDTGRVSIDLQAVADAASHGRVAAVFLPGSARCGEPSSTGKPTVVRLGADERFARCELMDRAAADTLVQGGQVHASPDLALPGGADLAAVLRY